MREFLDGAATSMRAERFPFAEWSADVVRNRHPIVFAKYLNGVQKEVCVRNKSAEEIASVLERLRSESGVLRRANRTRQFSSVRSIQGTWHPFLHIN